ncbi:MAG: T9SS type A sorting domain-containing protein [Chitinophagales bacterium]
MKNTFTFSFFLLFTCFLSAQNVYKMGDVPMTADCEGIFYDDGGNIFPGFYSNQLGQPPQEFTICPEGAGCVVMDFEEFVTENSSNLGPGDVLYVYDGPDSNSLLIGIFSGALNYNSAYSNRTITAGSGCMTFVFDENGGFTTIGWEATWTCFAESCETSENLSPPVDCVNAAVTYGDLVVYTSNASGEEELISQGIQGCISSGETHSAWIDFRIQESAPPNIPLTFTLSPKSGGEDYDFAIYGPNQDCSNLQLPIRCSYAEETFAGTIETGLRIGETDVSESPTVDDEGKNANGFVAPIIVNPGEQYFLVINNFSSNNVGADIVWGEEVHSNNLLIDMNTAIEAYPFFETLQIHPNPATDLLQLSLNVSKSATAKLQWFNAQGKLVSTENLQITQNGWKHSVNVADFAVGMYYLYLQTDEGMVVDKVMVVR